MSERRTVIRCYVSPAGNDKIADWYGDLSVKEKTDAEAFLSIMQAKREWVPPEYKPSMFDGIGELRWTSERKQHRLLGFFGDSVWYALVGCTHKQRIYKPADAIMLAKKYKGQIERKEVKTDELDL